LETLCKKHDEAVRKLKKENTTLELMVQSHVEPIMELSAENRLNRMGEDDDEDEDDGGDAIAPPAAATPELVVKGEEEDLKMLILE
jgi:hypothetical protein